MQIEIATTKRNAFTSAALMTEEDSCERTEEECFASIAKKYPHWKEKTVRSNVYKCCTCVCDDC